MKDTLNRRSRFAPPQAVGQRIELQERDLQAFEAVHRHGPLPTHYLYEFVRSLSKDRTAFQQRLTKLYNGTASTPPLLVRPAQQHASFYARCQPLIYDLSPFARAVLAERGRLTLAPARTDHFLHRFMNACVGASLELAVRQDGKRYLAEHDIFTHGGAGELAVPVGSGRLIPDRLFGIDLGGRYRFFAVEIDRNTESLERRSLAQNSFAQKIEGYAEILNRRLYKSHWDVPQLMVMFVTTNAVHMENMMHHVEDHALAKHFLFKVKPEFGVNWSVPPLLPDLFTEPWLQPDGSPFAID